ncbi:MAG: hemoglobin [Rhizobacter sp.]|nr:hemoglobin [Ferruginibacter sp.]
MTSQQIDLIKSSWEIVAVNPDLVGQLFYSRLFEIAPEVKPMFGGTSILVQSKKLVAMLSWVVRMLDTEEDIRNELTKLAQRHVKYGVEEKHYKYVGSALLWTLEKGLGNHWTLEVKRTWATCYAALSSTMIHAVGTEKNDKIIKNN